MFSRLECRRVSPLLWEHAEGGLRDPELKVVEQHLKRCAACSHALANAQKLQDGLSACRSQELPASRATWHALRAQIEVQNQATAVASRRRSSRAPIWAASAAAGVIAALIVVPMLSRRDDQSSIFPIKGTGVDSSVRNPQLAEVKPQEKIATGPGVQASEIKTGDKGPKVQSPKPARGTVRDAFDRSLVKQQVRIPKKAQQKNNVWSKYKPNPHGQIELAGQKNEVDLPAGLDGAHPSNPGRDYVMSPGLPAGRSSSHEYVMGTIGDSRARIIPASITSEEHSVW